MKLLAETTGPFGLIDLSTGHTLNANRPSVISRSGFIDARIALNQIVKVADVPDEANDDDFEEYWNSCDGDRELAVASYLSKFDPEAPAPKQRKGK